MATIAKRRDRQTCDVCEEPSEKVYAFGALILGHDLRTGDQIVNEHCICSECLEVLIDLVLHDQIPPD